MKKILVLLLAVMCIATLSVGCKKGTKDTVSLSQTEISIMQYDTATLTADSNVSLEKIVWSSANEQIATVANGKISAIGLGETVITVKAGKAKAECTVKVTEQTNVARIEFDKTETQVRTSGSVSVTAQAFYKNSPINADLVWSSSDTSVATVVDGMITGVKEGTATISATFTHQGKIIEQSLQVTVVLDLELGFVQGRNASLKTNGTIDDGQNVYQLVPYAKYNGQAVQATFTYESSETSVATVDANGLITAVNAGESVITMTVKIDDDDLSDREFKETFTVEVVKSTATINAISDFEVYKDANVTLKEVQVGEKTQKHYAYELTANTLDVDLTEYVTELGIDISGEIKAMFISEDTEFVTSATASGNVISVDGKVLGSKIYGEGISVQIETINTIIIAEIGTVVTKYISSTDDLNKMPFYGNLDRSNEHYNYYGYFVMTNDIDYEDGMFDYRREMSGVIDMAQEGYNFYGQRGFEGIFDGKGYAVKNVYTEGSKVGGMFLNATRNSVIMNFDLTMSINQTVEYYYTHAFGYNVGSEIKNVNVTATVLEGSKAIKNGYYALARNLTYARLENVTVNFDAEFIPSLANLAGLCEYMALRLGENVATFNNVEVNVIKPVSYTEDVGLFMAYLGEYTFNDSGLTYKVISKHRRVDQAPYEVYTGVTDGVATFNANKLTTELLIGESQIKSVSIQGENQKLPTMLSASDYSFADDTLTINGAVFGSSVYGLVKITVTTENGVTVIEKTVVTKYISTKSDVENLFIYGGVDTTEFTNYDGYFVMTQNIDLGYAHVLKYRKNAESVQRMTRDNNGTSGFKGIFDGKGYTMYNYMAGDKVGIFGNTAVGSVVKNLGIVGKVEVKTYGSATYPLAYNFSGALENSYIDLTVATDSLTAIPVAHFVGCASFKDVVIKFDATKSKFGTVENSNPVKDRYGFFAEQMAVFSGKWYNGANFNNTSVFLKAPSGFDTENGEYTAGSWYGTETTSTAGLTRYEYDAKPELAMTDTNYWNITEETQIAWKSLGLI